MSTTLSIILFFACFILPFSAQAVENLELCSAEELQSKLADHNLVIIDARSALSYRKGHIKGALHLDAGCSGPLVEKVGEVPCYLKNSEEIVVLLEKKGVCPQREIVVYGDRHAWGAEGRLFWLLKKLGFSNIALLDGGYDHWQSNSGPTSAIFADHKTPCKASDMVNLSFAKLQRSNLNGATLQSRYQEGNLIFLDVRNRNEYEGAILYHEKRGGHLPEALHLHWEDFWNDDYTLKAKAELLKKVKEAGLPLPEQAQKKLIVTYCTGGIRSGFTWFVLSWLGYPEVENYDNGFWEWASRPELPIEH